MVTLDSKYPQHPQGYQRPEVVTAVKQTPGIDLLSKMSRAAEALTLTANRVSSIADRLGADHEPIDPRLDKDVPPTPSGIFPEAHARLNEMMRTFERIERELGRIERTI